MEINNSLLGGRYSKYILYKGNANEHEHVGCWLFMFMFIQWQMRRRSPQSLTGARRATSLPPSAQIMVICSPLSDYSGTVELTLPSQTFRPDRADSKLCCFLWQWLRPQYVNNVIRRSKPALFSAFGTAMADSARFLLSRHWCVTGTLAPVPSRTADVLA